MRVMVIVKATTESEAGIMPGPELFEAMGRYNEELLAAGILKAGEGLKPSREGRRVHFDGERRTVEAGPFARPEELIAGYWIWEVADLDEAEAWARRCPNPMPGPSALEIRPLFEMADFGDAMPAGERDREERMRAELGGD
jgi:hypothetical protein